MCLFAESGLSTLLVLAALAMTTGFLLMRWQRYFSRQQRSQSPIVHTAPPESHDSGHMIGAPDEVLKWEVQMHDVARDLSAQLDSKMGALEHLIREADRAAARLEDALRAAQPTSAPSPDARHQTPQTPACFEETSEADPPPTSQADSLRSADPTERAARSEKVGVGNTTEGSSGERRYEEIYLLANYGFDAAAISHRVGIPVGEVELILGLRDKR